MDGAGPVKVTHWQGAAKKVALQPVTRKRETESFSKFDKVNTKVETKKMAAMRRYKAKKDARVAAARAAFRGEGGHG